MGSFRRPDRLLLARCDRRDRTISILLRQFLPSLQWRWSRSALLTRRNCVETKAQASTMDSRATGTGLISYGLTGWTQAISMA